MSEKTPLSSSSVELLSTKKISDSLKSVLREITQTTELNSENLLYIVTKVMTAVGRYRTLSGGRKKQIVIILITDAISQIEDPLLKQTLMASAEFIVPNAIDLLVDVASRKFSFNRHSKIYKFVKNLKCC